MLVDEVLSGNWYEVTTHYKKSEIVKEEDEQIVIDSLTFGEAEIKAIEETTPYAVTPVKVKTIKTAQYTEILFSNDSRADKFYKARIDYITLDEKSGKEKRQAHYLLVQSFDPSNAIAMVKEFMNDSVVDYVTVSVVETKIVECYPSTK